MHVIPVIDLHGGVVVHARGGDRSAYRPIATPLSPSAQPVDVCRGLLSLFPFDTFYIADLDAIDTGTAKIAVLEELEAAFPSVTLWADTGIKHVSGLTPLARFARIRPVIGSESLQDLDALRFPRAILSLDFKGGASLGLTDVDRQPQLWPDTVIVMSLDAVGAQNGPDFARLSNIVAIAETRRVYAAGGVRSAADLHRLNALGVHGALAATSLHSGALSGGDLARLSSLANDAKGGLGRPPD